MATWQLVLLLAVFFCGGLGIGIYIGVVGEHAAAHDEDDQYG